MGKCAKIRLAVCCAIPLCAFLGASIASDTVYAQEAASTQQEQKPVPRLDKSGVDAFQADLTQLSQQFSASFVVEGVPLRKTVLTEPAEAKPNVPQAVADFAAAYDYAAMKSDGVFMFRKNYTQPDDVPLVTLAECRLALHDATFLLGKFLYIPPPHPYIEPVSVLIMSREKTRDILFDSITDAQWKQILRPAGMHFADLKPEQQQGVIHYVLRLNSQTILARTLGTEYHLDILAQRKPVVCLRDGESLGGETLGKELRGLVLMGYEYPAKKNNYPVFRPQNYPVFIRPDSQAVQYGLVYDKNDKTKFINIGKDETEPSASDFALAKLGKAAPTVYLSEAVQKLNVRADKGGAAKSPAFAVDAALAEKPVLIVGDKAAPTVLFRALADVYGLRVTKDANGTQHMVRFRPKPPRTIQEMSPVLEAALPLPLQKVLHSQKAANAGSSNRLYDGAKCGYAFSH